MDPTLPYYRATYGTVGSPLQDVSRSINAVQIMEMIREAIESGNHSGLTPDIRKRLRKYNGYTPQMWDKEITQAWDIAKATYARTKVWFASELGIKSWKALLKELDPDNKKKKSVDAAVQRVQDAITDLLELVGKK